MRGYDAGEREVVSQDVLTGGAHAERKDSSTSVTSDGTSSSGAPVLFVAKILSYLNHICTRPVA